MEGQVKEKIRKAAGVMKEVWKIGKKWFGGECWEEIVVVRRVSVNGTKLWSRDMRL